MQSPGMLISILLSVWVRLPNLTLHVWIPSALECIENYLSEFISISTNTKNSLQCILVETDIQEVLLVEISLKVETSKWNLDCEKLPFRCTNCFGMGHLSLSCPETLRTFGKADLLQGTENISPNVEWSKMSTLEVPVPCENKFLCSGANTLKIPASFISYV